MGPLPNLHQVAPRLSSAATGAGLQFLHPISILIWGRVRARRESTLPALPVGFAGRGPQKHTERYGFMDLPVSVWLLSENACAGVATLRFFLGTFSVLGEWRLRHGQVSSVSGPTTLSPRVPCRYGGIMSPAQPSSQTAVLFSLFGSFVAVGCSEATKVQNSPVVDLSSHADGGWESAPARGGAGAGGAAKSLFPLAAPQGWSAQACPQEVAPQRRGYRAGAAVRRSIAQAARHDRRLRAAPGPNGAADVHAGCDLGDANANGSKQPHSRRRVAADESLHRSRRLRRGGLGRTYLRSVPR